jgi:uncharacterized repeat protein (TIGR02543 family)
VDFTGQAARAKTLMAQYAAMDNNGRQNVNFMWGHGLVIKDSPDLDWFCQQVAGHADTIWNPTCIEFVDYINAQRQMDVSFNAAREVVMANPTAVDLWMSVFNKTVVVPAGQTATAAAPTGDCVVSGYLTRVDGALTQAVNDKGETVLRGETGAVAVNGGSVTPRAGGFTVRQTNAACNTDYIALDDPWIIPNGASPLIIDAKYTVKADGYGGGAPQVGVAFGSDGLGLVEDNRVFGALTTPTAGYESVSRAMRFIIDPAARKVLVSEDGGFPAAYDFYYDMTALRDLRMYLIAKPDAAFTDGVTALASPVTWDFDYARAYFVPEAEALRVIEKTEEIVNGKIIYAVDIKNDSGEPQTFAAVNVLFDGDGKPAAAGVAVIKGLRPQFTRSVTGEWNRGRLGGGYRVETYFVVMKPDGGEISATAAMDGDGVIFDATASKAGHAFAGWYADPALTQPVPAPVALGGNMVLYAGYTLASCTIRFSAGEGSAVAPIALPYGSTIDDAPRPVRAGWAFDGWFTEPALIHKAAFPYTVLDNATLYARRTEFSGGGTSSEPYEIDSLDTLRLLAAKVNAGEKYTGVFFAVTESIDCGGAALTCIGNGAANYFNGNFNGGGYTIENFVISGASYVGLFGYIGANAAVRNLTVANGRVTASGNNAGAVAGYAGGGKMENCENRSVDVTANAIVGGVVGEITGAGALLAGCKNSGAVTTRNAGHAGGIAGSVETQVNGCFNSGTVTAAGTSANSNLGGIAGRAIGSGGRPSSHISGCGNTGNIGTLDYKLSHVGGILGRTNYV